MSTPGPWRVQVGHYPGFLEIVGASFRVSVVLSATNLTWQDGMNRAADAYLMAASPLLLEAAKKAMAECCDLIGTPAGDALGEAIEQAEGIKL